MGDPPCHAHLLGPAGAPVDPRQAADVARWRKAERARLIGARREIAVADRPALDAAIAAALDDALGPLDGRVVSICWPIRGEPDLRGWAERIAARGARLALPVVVERGAPLAFFAWTPGEAMIRGVWGIPQPARARPVDPDVVLAPVVGYDPGCYRLGYGGGYFDRTLAARRPRPLAAGVGHALAAIPTIFPQPHDVPLDLVATPEGVTRPAAPG